MKVVFITVLGIVGSLTNTPISFAQNNTADKSSIRYLQAETLVKFVFAKEVCEFTAAGKYLGTTARAVMMSIGGTVGFAGPVAILNLISFHPFDHQGIPNPFWGYIGDEWKKFATVSDELAAQDSYCSQAWGSAFKVAAELGRLEAQEQKSTSVSK